MNKYICKNCFCGFKLKRKKESENIFCSQKCYKEFYKKQKEELLKNGLKKCSGCKDSLPFDSFNKDKRSQDGFYCYCKNCIKFRNLGNKDKIKTRKKIYVKNNKEKISKYNRLYRLKNIDKERKRQKDYKKNNKEKYKMSCKKSYIKNYKKILKRNFLYVKEREKRDVNFMLLNKMRRVLSKKIKNNSKIESTIYLTGCSIEELKIHLEKQFKEGMSWENYGLYGWHIDHIRPCASFDLSNPEGQKECFHYLNLQPLWWWENLEKSDKIEEKYNNI